MPDSILARRLDWYRQGTSFLTAAVGRLADAQLAEPSRLPGWSRADVLAHLARNCDALGNLLTWARTGVETPMYSSPEQRDGDIERTAALAPDELRADLSRSTAELDRQINQMTEADWDGPVRTRQGRAVTGAEVPWMRCREVWVHAVDLGAGAEFTDVPADVGTALLIDACGFAAVNPAAPSVRIIAADAPFERVLGDGTDTVERPLAELLSWVLGRVSRPELPLLPPWL